MARARAYFDDRFDHFAAKSSDAVLGQLTREHGFALDAEQKGAWLKQVEILQTLVADLPSGHIFVEFHIPRMGKRADAILLIHGIIFILEFKIGATEHYRAAAMQALDYALDLKNFHSGSHDRKIVPIAIATRAQAIDCEVGWYEDDVAHPVSCTDANLGGVIHSFLEVLPYSGCEALAWANSHYKPTPTIIEAAQALYANHSVEDISRSDAGAINLSRTAASIASAIDHAKANQCKVICLVTGVPGAGKTLAGLNLVVKRNDQAAEEHAVFLSGNGPLVEVMREALAISEVERSRHVGQASSVTKQQARRTVAPFVQSLHHFRDDKLADDSPPIERVVVFDEAQRAWNADKTSKFMAKKRSRHDFNQSEPAFLLSVMDRHPGWCVVVCLVGGGQEIHTGEAGLLEWVESLRDYYQHWTVHCSSRLIDPEYAWGSNMEQELDAIDAKFHEDLHLAVSVRSFRSEAVAKFVDAVIAGNAEAAREVMPSLRNYPIQVTRDLTLAREWLRNKARGSERYGLVASSNALRLKPVGVHVKARVDPVYWFLNSTSDVRSSNYCEDVATEFDVQGLELDWVGVCWDANLRFEKNEWTHFQFVGSRWNQVKKEEKRLYLVNAYRVLLTRARQGMVIFIPEGSDSDSTRKHQFYDGTFEFLKACGIQVLA